MVEKSTSKDIVREIFTSYLEENSHRKTPERFAVLDEIYRKEGHFDIEFLMTAMNKKNHKISKATLYNTVELLIDCKLIKKNQFGKNLAEFEKSYNYRQHDHAICTKCDKVVEFCDPRIQDIKTMVEKIYKFSDLQHSLNLYGLCESCRIKADQDIEESTNKHNQ
ncbi:MAG: transcriptional repressor [Flavobacteriales bacterium]|nr:transcriptional repressor [Flavobacteriales bacterium]